MKRRSDSQGVDGGGGGGCGDGGVDGGGGGQKASLRNGAFASARRSLAHGEDGLIRQ